MNAMLSKVVTCTTSFNHAQDGYCWNARPSWRTLGDIGMKQDTPGSQQAYSEAFMLWKHS